MSTDTNNRKRKNTGTRLLWIGLVVTIFAIAIILAGTSLYGLEPESIPYVYGGILGILISFFMITIGLGLKITSVPGISLVALACGISGFLLPPLSLLAIILGAISLARSRRNPAIDGRTAIASMVLGVISIIIWGIWILVPLVQVFVPR